jgi:vanillate O-demethylase monooxygenase subunit
MAPSKTSPWLCNTWYVACVPDEVAAGPLARTICGEQVVLFRGRGGQATAVENFCPHRGAPLSLGRVHDGQLVCGYHGLVMGCDGRAASMPGQDVARFPAIRAYPVIERYGFIWIWIGDSRAADPAKLPVQAWAEDPDWAYGGGLYHVACDFRLMIDNLMDLTHETYVHATSIGQKEIDEAPVTTRLEGDQVVTERFMDAIMAPPFWRMALKGAGLSEDEAVDRWQICRFTLPSQVMIDVGVALAGRGGYRADKAHKVSSIVVDFMTPETETSHWYFWGMARNFAAHDEALTAQIRDGQAQIFSEDMEMLERQQSNLSRNPSRRLLRLNIDAGGVQSRLVIERAIQAAV